jgi:hypothetical protein
MRAHFSNSCGISFSDIHYEYRCADFLLFTKCFDNCGSTVVARTLRQIGETQIQLQPAEEGVARPSLAPNPTDGQFSISIPLEIYEDPAASITIVNSAGTAVLQAKIAETDSNFNFSDFPSGMYLVKIAAKDKVYTLKLMLE